MSEQQQKFDDLMKLVIKVSPEELRRRLKAEKSAKKGDKSTLNTPKDSPNSP